MSVVSGGTLYVIDTVSGTTAPGNFGGGTYSSAVVFSGGSYNGVTIVSDGAVTVSSGGYISGTTISRSGL